ncbi:MAG: hypothetical protein PHY45_02470 [Rhodocyclaceae bacterium]|nr:hypothetical protein [Rhodocyclaceae bacterium]
MASVVEQIVARVASILGTGLTCAVERSREAALSRGELPCVVVMPSEEDSESVDARDDKSTFILALEIHVRGTPWDQVADPIALSAHALIVKDAVIASLVARVRRHSTKWEGHDADATAGVMTRHYRFIYLTPAESL